MKKILFLFSLLLIALISESQTFSIKEYLSKNCNDEACMQSFFESKGFGKEVVWKKDPVMIREEWILNEAGVAPSVNIVRGGIENTDLYCLFGTNDKTTFDNLLQEIKQIGFRQNGYRNEDYGQSKFYNSENYKNQRVGAAEVVKGGGNYKYKYWVSISKFNVIVKKDPYSELYSELFTQIEKSAKPQKFTNSANKFFYYEKFVSAEAEAQKNIKANPGSAEDYYWLILSQVELKKLNEAKSNSEAAIKSTKINPLIMVAKGHILLQENKEAEARKLFDAALKADDKNGLTRMEIARAYADAPSKQGDVTFGIQVLKEAVGTGISNPDMLVTLGMLLRKLSIEYNGVAFDAFKKAAEVDPSYARAFYRIGSMFQSQNNVELLLEYYSNAIKADPQYAPAYLALHQYYSFRDVNKGVEYLTLYLKYSDSECDNHFYAADYLYRVGKNIESLTKTEEIEKGVCKENLRIKLLKAYNHNRLGDSLQAKNLMEDYFSSVPAGKIMSPDYRFAADLNARFKGAEPVAEKFYQKTIDTDTSKQEQLKAAQACAVMFEKIKDHKKTAYWYQQVVNRKPNPTNVDLFKLGTAYYNAGEYNNSKKIFEAYADKYPNDWRGFLWQARCTAQTDSLMKTGEAAPLYEKYLSLGGNEPANKKTTIEAYMYLFAVSYNLKKDKALAVSYLDKVLAIDPQNANALKYKEQLK